VKANYLQKTVSNEVLQEKTTRFICATTKEDLLSLFEIKNEILVAGRMITDKTQMQDALHIKRMILYHTLDPIKLVNSTIDLAIFYFIKDNYIKTAGLFNFAINVLSKITEDDIFSIIENLKKCSLKNILAFISAARNKISPSTSSSDVNLTLLKEINSKNLNQLESIRALLLKEFNGINENNIEQIKNIYENCFKLMRQFLISLIEESMDLIGKCCQKLAFIYFGSHSRKQATPYSDIEFGIISETDDILYPKELTKLILLWVINLGETVLSSLGISAYDLDGKKVTFNGYLYDTHTRDGYSFDQYVPQACKTPLGKKVDGKLIYRLIGTPSTLAASFSSSSTYQVDPYLPQIGMLSAFVYGDRPLYSAFQRQLADVRCSPYYGLSLVDRDIEKYLPILTKTITKITHKNAFYRPFVLLDDLYTCYTPIKNCDFVKKINKLYDFNVIDAYQKQIFLQILLLTMFLRFKLHYKYNEQKVDILSTGPSSVFTLVQKIRGELSKQFGFFKSKLDKASSISLLKEATLANKALAMQGFFSRKSYTHKDIKNEKSVSLVRRGPIDHN
jgi:predicted nucleotidyltransferase